MGKILTQHPPETSSAQPRMSSGRRSHSTMKMYVPLLGSQLTEEADQSRMTERMKCIIRSFSKERPPKLPSSTHAFRATSISTPLVCSTMILDDPRRNNQVRSKSRSTRVPRPSRMEWQLQRQMRMTDMADHRLEKLHSAGVRISVLELYIFLCFIEQGRKEKSQWKPFNKFLLPH
jgi:hypothetical protein